MNEYVRIALLPTVLTPDYIRPKIDYCNGFHESLLRSYNVLQKVKNLLQNKVPPEVVLDLIEIMTDDYSDLRNPKPEE